MATESASAALTVKQLLEAIERLSPAERRELQRQVLAWQDENGRAQPDEAELVRAAKARLPATQARRLRRLIAKSEMGTLTPAELVEYRALAQRSEQLDVVRVEALAELARRRGQPAHLVQKEISGEGDAGGT
jgi:hypothetical protein